VVRSFKRERLHVRMNLRRPTGVTGGEETVSDSDQDPGLVFEVREDTTELQTTL
jgi:hypothetical protein